MSQASDSPTKTFTAGAAIPLYLRVYLSAGKLAKAGTGNVGIGTMATPAFADLDVCSVRLKTAQGTHKMVASEAISAGSACYAGANGKVAATGTIYEGIALEAAGADGDVIEVMSMPNTDVSSAITGTTAATFVADSDVGKPRVAIGSQTGGTGDYVAQIKPPATLTADRVFTLAGDAAATIANIAGAQTFTDKTLSTGTLDLRDTVTLTPNSSAGAGNSLTAGYTQVTVTTVTNDANDFIVLPAIASVGIGHQIRISCNAGGNFEMRTPASSNTKINDVDADGTQEYLCTDTDLIIVTKHTTTGWVAQSLTKLGAVRTAVIPD